MVEHMSFDKKPIRNKREAVQATEYFVLTVNKSDRSNYKELRRLVDDEDIVEKIECDSFEGYINKYFPSNLNLKSIRNRLNVARMEHSFEENGVTIPDNVLYTTLRDLMNAFSEKDKDQQLDLQLKVWEAANVNKTGKCVVASDIENAVGETQLVCKDEQKKSKVSEYEDEIASLKLEQEDAAGRSEEILGQLPDDVSKYAKRVLLGKIIKSEYFWNNLTDVWEMIVIDDVDDLNQINVAFDENTLSIKEFVSFLKEHTDSDELVPIIKSIFDYGANEQHRKRTRVKIERLEKKIKK